MAPAMTPRLGERQERSIAHATARINIWSGAVRSGKTIASLLRWLMYIAHAPAGGALVVSGKTLDTVARNVFGPLQDPTITGSFAQHVHYTRKASVARILGREVEVITAADERAESRLRGLTAAGAYCDELTLLPESFFTQLLARLSVPGAQLFATTNPDGPAHWVRRKYILRQGELNLRHWHFNLDDNPALDPQYVRDLKAEYTGLWYRRFINGEWCLAEGSVYDMWDEDRHVVSELPKGMRWLSAGVDYGNVNPFAALLLGLGPDGCLYLADEWRYDSKTKLRQLTDAEYSERVRSWLTGRWPDFVVVDPSAASFRNQLYYDGLTATPGDNEVLDGIRTVASLFGSDRLKVHKSCKGFIDEIPGYAWDDDKADKGEDAPIKTDDHSLDAGRYAIHTTRALWHTAIRSTMNQN